MEGIRTIVFLSETFLALGNAHARSPGAIDVPVVYLPFDLVTGSPERARDVAANVYHEVKELVLSAPRNT